MENSLFKMESIGSQKDSFLSNTDSRISSVVSHGSTFAIFIMLKFEFIELFVLFVNVFIELSLFCKFLGQFSIIFMKYYIKLY